MQRPALLALLVVGCVLVFLFLRPRPTPLTPLESKQALGLMASPDPSPSAASTPVSKAAAPAADMIPAAEQEVIRRCLERKSDLPTVHYSKVMRLPDLLRDLGEGSAHAPENLVVNVHIKKPDGSTQRLHIEPHSNEAKGSTLRWPVGLSDARIFDVDNEGLPIEAPFPASLKLEVMKSIIDAFASQGTVTFSERRFHQRYNQDTSADIVESAGHVSELQLFFSGNSLGCAWSSAQGLSCKCL